MMPPRSRRVISRATVHDRKESSALSFTLPREQVIHSNLNRDGSGRERDGEQRPDLHAGRILDFQVGQMA